MFERLDDDRLLELYPPKEVKDNMMLFTYLNDVHLKNDESLFIVVNKQSLAIKSIFSGLGQNVFVKQYVNFCGKCRENLHFYGGCIICLNCNLVHEIDGLD